MENTETTGLSLQNNTLQQESFEQHNQENQTPKQSFLNRSKIKSLEQ